MRILIHFIPELILFSFLVSVYLGVYQNW